MALFDKVWQQMNTRLDQVKLNKEVERFRQALQMNPNDTESLRQLGTIYQTAGMTEDAIQCFMRLAELYKQTKQTELALAYYRKVERMGDNERRASILKEIESIVHGQGQFEEAYRTCRQIVEVYLSINQKEAARGFINSLSPFGDKDELYRKELKEMIGVKDENWAQGARGTWIEDQSTQPNASPQPVAPLPGYPATRTVVASPEEQVIFADMSILVVDDDPNICLILTMAIKQLGCQVISANNGMEALDKALRLRPNLILSDLLMPKMDGSQLFIKLQEYSETRSIPFVCLTSRGQEEEKLAAFQKGVEDYWVKPFSVAEITMRIKKLLQRQLQSLQNEFLSAGAGRVELAGNLAELTPADLLRFCEAKSKSGILRLRTGEIEGAIIFQNGEVYDAQYASLVGEPALFTLLNWTEGTFTFQSQSIAIPRTIISTTNEILAHMMQRYDEEYYLTEQLPNVEVRLALSAKFNEALQTTNFPRSVERLMILFDGSHKLGDCLEQLRGDTEALRLLVDLYRQGLIIEHNS
ncbi:MAG: response regulator [Acidobacteriota bacterium]